MKEPRPEIIVQTEGLRSKVLIAILITSIVVIVISVLTVNFWVGGRLELSARIHGPAPDEISRIPQTLVQAPSEAKRRHDSEERHLASYEWVDRRAGTVRIPIERAFDLLTGGRTP